MGRIYIDQVPHVIICISHVYYKDYLQIKNWTKEKGDIQQPINLMRNILVQETFQVLLWNPFFLFGNVVHDTEVRSPSFVCVETV